MPKNSAKFEESMTRLEKIVEELENGEFSLEDSLARFEEGLKLGNACRAMLDTAEARVRKLMEDAEKAEVAGDDAGDSQEGKLF